MLSGQQRRFALTVFLLGMLACGVVEAQARARCSALWVAGRALVTVELEQLLDPELLRLIRLGLEGRVKLHLSLVRTHALWFDEALAETTTESVITFDPQRPGFVLDGRHPLSTPETWSTERLVLRPEATRDPKGHYRVDVHADLQVVTAQSLGQMARWMGGATDASRPVADRVLQTLAEDLVRSADGRCEPQVH